MQRSCCILGPEDIHILCKEGSEQSEETTRNFQPENTAGMREWTENRLSEALGPAFNAPPQLAAACFQFLL